MAVPQLRHESWRLPGCGDACHAIQVIRPGMFGRPEVVLHDPAAHEDWGRVTGGAVGSGIVWTGALVIDRLRRTVHVGAREIAVTPREWAILDYLAANLSRVCPHSEILTSCWGPEWFGELHLLRVNMARLRPKLGPCAKLIETCGRGRGYRLRCALPIESAPAPPPKPWSRSWDRCRDCSTTARAHGAHGRCSACAARRARSGAGTGGTP